MITWASIILKALGLINVVLALIRDERLRGLGRKEAIAAGLEAAKSGMEIADAARKKVVDDIAADPSKLHADDGFKRRKT